MDHALEIGDWIEIPLNSRSCIGQVHEITWRSTTIIGWFNEIIQVPNRVLANSHLINYKKGEVPIYRSVTFYFPYTADVGQVKNIIKNCVQNLPYIKKDVPINVLVIDQQPQYFTIRVSLPLEDFSMQYHVFNLLFEKTLSEIAQAGFLGLTIRLPFIQASIQKKVTVYLPPTPPSAIDQIFDFEPNTHNLL